MPIYVYTSSFVIGLRSFDLNVSSSLDVHHDYIVLWSIGTGLYSSVFRA